MKKNMKKFAPLGLLVIVIIAVLAIVLSDPAFFLTPYQKIYAGGIRNFRADLNEAAKTPVYPNENAIKNVLLNPEVHKIHIAYFSNETENSFYFATSFEIALKIGLVYKNFMGVETQTIDDEDGSTCMIFYPNRQVRCFRSIAINSTDELNPSFTDPVILMLGPSHANQTAVTVYNFMIILEGKSFEEVDRVYTDLDLAVDKMLLVLMES
ncbi:MAG: hypothetical protein ABIE55_00070 [Candidatus Aenigmatarchaeota archaeon]